MQRYPIVHGMRPGAELDRLPALMGSGSPRHPRQQPVRTSERHRYVGKFFFRRRRDLPGPGASAVRALADDPDSALSGDVHYLNG